MYQIFRYTFFFLFISYHLVSNAQYNNIGFVELNADDYKMFEKFQNCKITNTENKSFFTRFNYNLLRRKFFIKVGDKITELPMKKINEVKTKDALYIPLQQKSKIVLTKVIFKDFKGSSLFLYIKPTPPRNSSMKSKNNLKLELVKYFLFQKSENNVAEVVKMNRSFLKNLYKNHYSKVKEFIKRQKLDIKSPKDILKIHNYYLSLQ